MSKNLKQQQQQKGPPPKVPAANAATALAIKVATQAATKAATQAVQKAMNAKPLLKESTKVKVEKDVAQALGRRKTVRSPTKRFKRLITSDKHVMENGKVNWASAGMGSPEQFSGLGNELDGAFCITEHADGQGCDVSGVEMLAAVPGGTYPTGTILVDNEINPLNIGVRLPLVAQAYTKYQYTGMAFQVRGAQAPAGVPANGLLRTGTTLNAVQPDPQSSLEGVQAVATWAPNTKECAVWQSMLNEVRLDLVDQDELFVQGAESDGVSLGDDRLTYQAKNYLIVSSPIATSAALCNYYLFYRISLREPIVVEDPVTKMLCGVTGPMAQSIAASSSIQLRFVFGEGASMGNPGGTYGSNNTFGAGTLIESANDEPGYAGDTDFFGVSADGNSLLVPPGTYAVDVDVLQGTVGASGQVAGGPNISCVTLVAQSIVPAPPSLPSAIRLPVDGVVNGLNTLTIGAFANSTSGATLGPVGGPFGTGFNGISLSGASGSTTGGPQGFGSTCAVVHNRVIYGFAVPFKIDVLISGAGTIGGAFLSMAKFTITRIGSSYLGSDVSPIQLSVRTRALQRLQTTSERLVRTEVMAALSDTTDQADPMFHYVASSFFSTRQLTSLPAARPTTSNVAPAVAAAISWFVAEYGSKLGKMALDWGIRQIEDKLKK
jgi:hypothetical protein